MSVFPVTKRKDNNPDYVNDRKKLNELFIKVRMSKPEYFNKFANEFKNKGKVKEIFHLTRNYINGSLTISEIEIEFRNKKNKKI